MKRIKYKSYPLDNSAIIHLAAIKNRHTNSFRIAITLTEDINPCVLQSALDRLIPRFPTIAAGIQEGFFRHTVVPVQAPPKIISELECLAYMTKREIKHCAFRILYREKQIAGEFFHSLTDGYGGIVFMKSLLAEYLYQLHNISFSFDPMVLSLSELPQSEELADDYYTYAGNNKAAFNHRRVYQLPGVPLSDSKIHTTTRIFDTQELLDTAHYYDVSLTTLLTAVMATSIAEIQQKHSATGRCEKAIQIMIPVNLRKLFPSKTLRNFSLYVLPCVEAHENALCFESILDLIHRQLNDQITKEKMSAIMAAHTKLEQSFIIRVIPWALKGFILRIAQHFFGEQNSCISLSNLGEISLPKEMEQYVEQIDVVLTPRIKSLYNCGIVSYGGKCTINFSRLCAEPELEDCFFGNLSRL